MGSVRCLSCGHLNERPGPFCGRCGKRLPVKGNVPSGIQEPGAYQDQTEHVSIPEKIRLTREILSRNPDDVEARCELGEFYYRLGNMPLSEKEFKIAKAVDPNNLTAREYLSTIFREAGDDEGAAGELEVIESLPACPASSLLDLAELRLRLGRRKEALRALRKAVEKEPGNIKIRLRYEKLLIEEE